MHHWSRRAFLERLALAKERKLQHCTIAWYNFHRFAKPYLEEGIPKHHSPAFRSIVVKWTESASFSKNEIARLDLDAEEIDRMLRSICWEASEGMIKVTGEGQPTATPSVTTPAKRPRIEALPSNGTNTAEEPAGKRAKVDSEGRHLPVNTKIYFMEEGNRQSRTGIPILLLAKKEPKEHHLEIRSLFFGKLTTLLRNRTVYRKETHEIFYYDLENRNVRIVVDNCYSFRTGVEEMAFCGGSRSQIKFYIREKDSVPDTTAPATSPSMPKYTADSPHRGPRAWTSGVQRRLDFHGNKRQPTA